MLLRTVLGLEPEFGPNGLVARRPELATIDGLELLGLYSPPGRVDVRVWSTTGSRSRRSGRSAGGRDECMQAFSTECCSTPDPMT